MSMEPGAVLSGRYEIKELLGKGGMAYAYRAFDKKLERDVTVKVLRDDFEDDEGFNERFRTEARAVASLSHPNIVSVYDVGTDGNINYIVMEYVHGDTLKKAILEKSPFDTLTAVSVSIQIAAALSHAHKNHVVHRDIKPQNILISLDGTIKVTDFGIAKAVSSSTVAANANAVGSVHYFSPEQARGGYVDERSDIYSLGITMYEMVTGKLPYDGNNAVAVALKHIKEPLPDIHQFNPGISDTLERIIQKATQKNPDDRYANISLLLSDLKRALTEASADVLKKADMKNREAKKYTETETTYDMESARSIHLETDTKTESDKEQIISVPQSVMQPRGREELRKFGRAIRISHDDEYEDDEYEEKEIYEDDEDDYEQPERKSNEKKIIIAAVLTALIIILGITAFSMNLFMGIFSGNNKEDISVPTFIGITYEEAQEVAEGLGIQVAKKDTASSEKYDAGLVMAQDPQEGIKVAEGTTINLTISTGVEETIVPDVVGMDENKAIEKIKEETGVTTVQVEHEYSSDVEQGKVIRQSPESGKEVSSTDRILLTISKGEESKKVIVPDITNLTEEEAKTKLEEMDLKVGPATPMESKKVEAGHIITQTVSPGSEVARGTSVGYVISTGNEEEDVPPDQSGKDGEEEPEEPKTEQPVKPEQPDNQQKPEEPKTPKTISFTVNSSAAANGADSVHVEVVKINKDGSSEKVISETRKGSEFPISVSVSGTGEAELQLYLDGSFQWSQNVNFDEGGH
ncbi:MAG: Stk1 family PASTA domain-containing Ser/Thr kinase [Clostridiales bacterium]|nr:Stk1 family PASTA domain-containing Ser/Thr kinase [Clostridiales bacterium]